MNSLKDQIQIFEDNKVKIIKLWISSHDVLNMLDKHNVEKDIFIKNYAFSILNYYIGVVHGEKKIGDCPVIDKLLEYLRTKNIRTEDLFIICSGFKNAMINFTYENNINSKEMNSDINHIFEKNFAGVLFKYSKTIKETTTKLKLSDKIINKNIIMSTTDTKGIIISVSKAFEKISGYSEEELIGHSHNMVRHPDMPSELFADLWSTIKSGNTWKGEVLNLAKDGSTYWVYATITPNFNEDHIIEGYTSIRQDITAKKIVEEQQGVIIEQSKNTAIGEMIAMLAHQWRQPLQATAMLIQQLPLEKMLDDKISDETLTKVVDGTQKQLDYMSKTITDFTDFFKPNKVKEKVLVTDLIEKAREIVAYTLKVDGIELQISGDDYEINTHLIEVAQVIINLLKNANDILMERNIKNRKIKVLHYKKDDNVVIEVQDNAGGIPEELLPKIFEPYFTTKKNKNGSGLGLYSSKTTIEKQLNGLLIATNGKDGAIFKIILPIN